jgi:zinc protease
VTGAPAPAQGRTTEPGAVATGAPARAQERDVKLVETPPPVGGAPAFKLPPVQEKRLENGLRIIFLENHEQPVVTMSIMFRSGAASEPADKAGLAQMTTSLLDQGTATRSAQQIAEAIDSAGGGLSASAGWDSMTASTTVLANRTALAADLLADVLRNPAFKQEEIDRVRNQTLNGLRVARSNAGTVADEVFDRVVFGQLPYAHPIGGTEATIGAITRDDIVAFHKARFVPNNATLAIVGDLKAKEAFDLAEKTFGSWPQGDPPPPPKFVTPVATKYRFIILDKPDAAQTEIRAGMAGFSRNDPDYYAASVTNTILGGAPFSSRIESELRVKRGLTYGAGSHFDARALGGAFQVETNTKTATTAEAVQVILEQVAGLRAGEAPADELAARKGYLTGVFVVALETPEAVASRLLQAELYGLGRDYLDTYTAKVQAVTAADVHRIAETRIVPDQFVVVLAGNAAEFEEQIRKLGPVEKIPFDEVDTMSASLRRAAPAAAAAAPVSEADAKAGREMVDRTIAALGGPAFLGQKSLVLKGTGTLTPAPGRSLPIQSVNSWAVYPDKTRLELNLGVATVAQGSNGEVAWVQQPGGVQDITAEVKESRKYGFEVLRRFGAGGYTARPLPDAEVDGKPAKAFEVADAEGHATKFYVDPTTSLPVKVSFTTKQGATDVMLRDFRDVSGLKIPYAVEQWRNGAKFLEAVYTDAQVNVEVDPKLFEKP